MPQLAIMTVGSELYCAILSFFAEMAVWDYSYMFTREKGAVSIGANSCSRYL